MPDKIPFRVIDSIEGKALLEVRRAMQAIRTHLPGVSPTRAILREDAYGPFVQFEVRNAPALVIRQGASLPLPAAEADRAVASARPPRDGTTVTLALMPFIEQAAIEFRRKMAFQFEDYLVSIAEEDAAIIVMFNDRLTPPGARGSVGKAGFEVAFDRKSARVLRSNFVR